MRRNCLILTVFVVGSVLFLPIDCQGQALVAEESKPVLTESKPAVVQEKAKTTPEAKPAPAITFEKVVHDFGEVGSETKNVCEFKFTNTGDSLLRITRVSKTCGCTPYTLAKKEYAPGEAGTLKVKYNASKRGGMVTRTLYVYSNDKARPKVKLTVKAKIVQKVDCEPKKLNLLLKEENAGCPEITLTSLDGQPFSIKRFRSTANSITADVNSSVKATKFVIEAKVDIEKLRKNLNGRIDINLTHPECKTVTIPFNVLPEFKISPPSINILGAEPQKPVAREIWILNNYGDDFEVESASSKKGIIKVLSQERKGNRYKFELEITPSAAEGKTKTFSDVFFVNIKGGEKLEVTCRGFYAKK